MVIEREIKNIRISQSRLPPKFFDYSRFENLVEDLQLLELKRADHITAKIFCDNLLIIYCGSYLKYCELPYNDDASDIVKPLLDVKDIDLKLNESTEITKIMETINKNWL